MENTRSDRTILIHCMRPLWEHITFKWKLVYYTPNDQGDTETLEVTDRPKTEPVLYAALKLKVNLLIEGEVDHSSTRALDRKGYRFNIPPTEGIAMCRSGRESGAFWNPTSHLLAKMEDAQTRIHQLRPQALHSLFRLLSLALKPAAHHSLRILLRGIRRNNPNLLLEPIFDEVLAVS